MKNVRLLLSLVVFLQVVVVLHGQTPAVASGQMRSAIASIPLFFEANQGQTDPRVRFFSRSSGYTLFLMPEETVLVEEAAHPRPGSNPSHSRESKTSPRAVLRMKLLGARRAPEFVGIGELPGKVNYLIGNNAGGWHTGVPLYSQVQAKQVYPGVDLLFHGDQQQLEYDFVVAPGADPNQVAFQIEGAERIELDAQGNLVLHTQGNEIAFHKPLVYQPVGGERQPVDGRFVLKGREVGFEIAAYDRHQPLVIDPTITYATFLGGAGQDDGNGLVLDTSTPGAPKMYVAGTTSDDTTFPETGSNVVFLTETGASSYIFIAKIDPTLTGAASLDYLTFIGGGTPFAGTASPCYNIQGLIALETINSTVEPLVSGITSCQDYSVTQGSPTTGANDLVLTRLTPTGAALDLSEFFGGNGAELGGYVVLGNSGDIVLSAATSSTNLPATSGAYATQLDNGQAGDTVDCFVAKLDSSFTVQYLTYLNVGAGETINGLSGGEEGFSCGALEDSTGNVIAAGETLSSVDFSGVSGQPNGFQTTFQGTSDGFVMKLDPSLSGKNQLLYSTYLGGGGTTVPNYAISLTGTNLFAISGNTTSGESGTPPNIPLSNSYQTTNNADPSSPKGTGFVAVIDTTKTGSASLVCSTYLGGTLGDERVQGMAYDPVGGNFSTLRLILGGQTSSTTFPTLNPLQSSLVGSQDSWVAAMNVPATSSGPAATLSFSTYLGDGFEPSGDRKHETIDGIAVDANHNIYARGRSASPSPYFFGNTSPATTVNGFQTACESCTGLSSALDDVVVFLLTSWEPALKISPASLTFPGQLLNTTSAAKSVKLTNSGLAPLSFLPIVASGDYAISANTCPVDPSTLGAGLSCTFSVIFTPTVPGSVPGEVTITDTAAGSPNRVGLTGTGLTPISLSPTSLAFGTIRVGTTSTAKTVTLTNNLSTSLTVTGIVASGDYAVAGAGTAPCMIAGMSLAAKAKCTFSVTFTPEQNASAITGAATVAYSGNFNPQEVALTGGGSGGATASPLTFTPATLSFKSTLIGMSASMVVKVKNSSASSLSISGITAIGNYTAAGSGTTPCGGSLSAGATCTMTVTFNPSINGTIKGAVAIANSTAVNPQIYNVSGAAVLPLTFSPASLAFASQTVGSTSAAKTLTLTNNTGTAMSSISFVASGDYATFSSGGTPCGASLGAHASCTIGVTFTPSASGTIKGAVTVTYSGVAPNFSPQEMSLTGTGH